MGIAMKEHFTGLIAAVHTPMHSNGDVNLKAIEEQAQLLSAGGLRGVFVCGTTGEGMSLTVSERLKIAERWREVARPGFLVIVNVSHLCLEESKALAAHAQKIGADAIAATAPCFFKPANAEDLSSFCAEVADEAPGLPFYYYHIPSMTGVSIPLFDFLSAAEKRIPNLAGAKFTSHDLMDFSRCAVFREGKFNMLFGLDEMLLAGLALGAEGAVGSTYNFAAPLYHRIIESFRAGDMAAARTEQARAVQLAVVLEKFGGLPAGKAMLKMIGVDCGPVRLPLRTLSEEEADQLRSELERVGFFTYCLRASG